MKGTLVSTFLSTAAATFTLLAWGFAYAYFVCQAWYPGSFTGFEPERQRTWMELLFYSFTNLSATGLGDVLPVSAPARVLTMLEQFAGVGYIAAVVSSIKHARIARAALTSRAGFGESNRITSSSRTGRPSM